MFAGVSGGRGNDEFNAVSWCYNGQLHTAERSPWDTTTVRNDWQRWVCWFAKAG